MQLRPPIPPPDEPIPRSAFKQAAAGKQVALKHGGMRFVLMTQEELQRLTSETSEQWYRRMEEAEQSGNTAALDAALAKVQLSKRQRRALVRKCKDVVPWPSPSPFRPARPSKTRRHASGRS